MGGGLTRSSDGDVHDLGAGNAGNGASNGSCRCYEQVLIPRTVEHYDAHMSTIMHTIRQSRIP